MELDFKKILNAWITAHHPTEQQQLLANKRQEVCDVCPSKREITKKFKIGVICNECGCPLAKKIFSADFNDCPLKKWESVDTTYFPKSKDSKSII